MRRIKKESAEPLDSDPIDVWRRKREAQIARRSALAKPGGPTRLSDDLPIEEWVRRRYNQLA